jgi:organic radical activating enzyme
MEANKRLDLKVGFTCNNSCRFCAQGHNRSLGDKSTNRLKSEMKKYRKHTQDIVFTGGEPTIRSDIIELVSYAKELGFETIQIQSNGRRFFYKEFCKELIEAGVSDFAPALHGHIPQLHDFLTRSKGSFMQTVTGIRNLKELKQTVLMNTVVTKPNYRHLPEIARLLVKLNVDQFQFAFVHPVGNAYKYFDCMVPRISLAAPFIHAGLNIGINAGKSVMAEAMPFCLMKGYEKYVSELIVPKTEVVEMSLVINDYDAARKGFAKTKFPQCKTCINFDICEGPWKEYPEKRGSSEFVPVEEV